MVKFLNFNTIRCIAFTVDWVFWGWGGTLIHSHVVIREQAIADPTLNTDILNIKLWPLITDIHLKRLPFSLTSMHLLSQIILKSIIHVPYGLMSYMSNTGWSIIQFSCNVVCLLSVLWDKHYQQEPFKHGKMFLAYLKSGGKVWWVLKIIFIKCTLPFKHGKWEEIMVPLFPPIFTPVPLAHETKSISQSTTPCAWVSWMTTWLTRVPPHPVYGVSMTSPGSDG